MRARASSQRYLWWWAAAGAAGLSVLAAVLLWAVGKGKPPQEPAAQAPQVLVTPLDKHTDVGEQAVLFDPKPLFLPTESNTYARPVPAEVLHQPGEVFRNFESKLSYPQTELALPVAANRTLPKQPLELLKTPVRQSFMGFGREDVTIAPPMERKGYVEVREMATGALVLAQNLGEDATPPAGRDWQPVEYLVAVNVAGLLGRPVVTASSQVETVDAYFRDYLAQSLHLGERLAQGLYRVVVGP